MSEKNCNCLGQNLDRSEQILGAKRCFMEELRLEYQKSFFLLIMKVLFLNELLFFCMYNEDLEFITGK